MIVTYYLSQIKKYCVLSILKNGKSKRIKMKRFKEACECHHEFEEEQVAGVMAYHNLLLCLFSEINQLSAFEAMYQDILK